MFGPTSDNYDSERYDYDDDNNVLVEYGSDGEATYYDADTGERVSDPAGDQF